MVSLKRLSGNNRAYTNKKARLTPRRKTQAFVAKQIEYLIRESHIIAHIFAKNKKCNPLTLKYTLFNLFGKLIIT